MSRAGRVSIHRIYVYLYRYESDCAGSSYQHNDRPCMPARYTRHKAIRRRWISYRAAPRKLRLQRQL